jgi:hypothetical protein
MHNDASKLTVIPLPVYSRRRDFGLGLRNSSSDDPLSAPKSDG